MLRAILLASALAVIASGASAQSNSSLSGGSTAGHLESPRYNTIGKTSSTHVTTMTPRKVIAPAGPLSPDEAGEALDATEADRPLLLERRLDCFSSAVAPDRDSRNRFLSRCPGNNR
jgi:hypothetical protein